MRAPATPPAILALLVVAVPANAAVRPGSPRGDPLADYVRGRVADDLGELSVSAQSFAAAYDAAPDNAGLALRTLRQAVLAGDMALAFRIAHRLDAAGTLPPDGAVLLAAEAVQRKDWTRATAIADRLQRDKLFAFLSPVLRAWIGFGQGHADAAALIDAAQGSPLAATYAGEHRVLLLLAGRDPSTGVAALSALNLPQGARTVRLRIAAAAALAGKGKRADALPLLVGDDPATTRARETLEAGRPLPGAILTAQAGIADLFARVASDVDREQAGTLALEFARAATFLDPRGSGGWLATASLLAGKGDTDEALAALARIPADDPFAGTARDARLALLVRAGRKDEALGEAKAAVDASGARPGDWSRYADMLSERQRYAEAADAYAKAIALSGPGIAPANAWPLLLQQANSQLQAGDWPGARATAERALAVSPEQPATLNFIGYSELDHGGDSAKATALIAKASELAPDDPSITDSLGWSWYLRGDVARAIPLLERAARNAPAETDINEHLGDAYWRAGRRLEARYSWRAALIAAEPEQATRLRAKIDGGPQAAPPARS
jgi:tetratricopeptide (TPR) repeat protein